MRTIRFERMTVKFTKRECEAMRPPVFPRDEPHDTVTARKIYGLTQQGTNLHEARPVRKPRKTHRISRAIAKLAFADRVTRIVNMNNVDLRNV